jgi:hypothetical protein
MFDESRIRQMVKDELRGLNSQVDKLTGRAF